MLIMIAIFTDIPSHEGQPNLDVLHAFSLLTIHRLLLLSRVSIYFSKTHFTILTTPIQVDTFGGAVVRHCPGIVVLDKNCSSLLLSMSNSIG